MYKIRHLSHYCVQFADINYIQCCATITIYFHNFFIIPNINSVFSFLKLKLV